MVDYSAALRAAIAEVARAHGVDAATVGTTWGVAVIVARADGPAAVIADPPALAGVVETALTEMSRRGAS